MPTRLEKIQGKTNRAGMAAFRKHRREMQQKGVRELEGVDPETKLDALKKIRKEEQRGVFEDTTKDIPKTKGGVPIRRAEKKFKVSSKLKKAASSLQKKAKKTKKIGPAKARD